MSKWKLMQVVSKEQLLDNLETLETALQDVINDMESPFLSVDLYTLRSHFKHLEQAAESVKILIQATETATEIEE